MDEKRFKEMTKGWTWEERYTFACAVQVAALNWDEGAHIAFGEIPTEIIEKWAEFFRQKSFN